MYPSGEIKIHFTTQADVLKALSIMETSTKPKNLQSNNVRVDTMFRNEYSGKQVMFVTWGMRFEYTFKRKNKGTLLEVRYAVDIIILK